MQFLTLSNNGPPQASAIAFFEWWDQEDGGTFLQLTGLPVHPGDVMLGAVWAKTKTTAIAYLRNLTTGTMAIVGATAPVVELSGDPPVELTISGATAEWILERPTDPNTATPYQFPAYSTTTFSCWAGAAVDSRSSASLARSTEGAIYSPVRYVAGSHAYRFHLHAGLAK